MADGTDSGESHGSFIPINDPSEIDRDGYWRRVERVLREVFHLHEDAARKKIEQMRGKLEELNLPGETIVYHATPLDTAADLAGRRRDEVMTPEERRRYAATNPMERDDSPILPTEVDPSPPED